MSTFRYEYIQCPDCGAMMIGRGKNSDAALQEALDDYITHRSDGHLDVRTRDGLEAALGVMEELLPGVSLTLSSHQ